MPFALNSRLKKGTHFIGKTGCCQILLKNNASFPWIMIVPEVEKGIEDLHQLSADKFAEVVSLIRQVSEFMSAHFKPEKLNVACIGNIVRQMHIHLVARSPDDPAWPDTVWASDAKTEYKAEDIIEICVAARLALGVSEEL